MRDPRSLLERWAAAPTHATDRLPRVEAEFLLAVLECDATDPSALAFATQRFAQACPGAETAVAHLLALRSVIDPTRLAHAVDGQIIELVSRELAEARHRAHTDPLTGLGNRRSLDAALPGAVARAERTGNGLALIYFDLVGLKAINDQYGHDAGDAALRDFAAALSGSARASDLSYRIGGDEFVVVMPDTNPDEVTALIDRIVAFGAPTFSWGSTNTLTEGFDAGRLIRVADLRMLSSRYRLTLDGGSAQDAKTEPSVDLRSSATSATLPG